MKANAESAIATDFAVDKSADLRSELSFMSYALRRIDSMEGTKHPVLLLNQRWSLFPVKLIASLLGHHISFKKFVEERIVLFFPSHCPLPFSSVVGSSTISVTRARLPRYQCWWINQFLLFFCSSQAKQFQWHREVIQSAFPLPFI
jgi:hypothetical protein